MADRHRLLADMTPLRESAAFQRQWAGTTLSSVGGACTNFAVILQVYNLTRPSARTVAVGISFIRRGKVLAGASLADLNATLR